MCNFCRLCGFDSACTIESMTPDDIICINKCGKSIISKIEDETGEVLSDEYKRALIGFNIKKPEDFEIVRGDEILLKKIADYTSKMVEKSGYGVFGKNVLDDTSKKVNVLFLKSRNMYVFAEVPVSANTVSYNVVDVSNMSNEPAQGADGVTRPLCDTSSTALAAPYQEHNSVSQAELPTTHQDTVDDNSLLMSLRQKLHEIIEQKLSAIGSIELRQQIYKRLKEFKLILSRKDEKLSVIAYCFCGAKSTLAYKQNKKGGGHFKTWNFQKHVTLSHISGPIIRPNQANEGKKKRNVNIY